MDDDYVGQAASMAAFAFSNNTNTASDRFVAAQIFALSIGCIMRAKPMTLDLVDNMKKDRVKDIIAESFNMLPPVGAGVRISGDAVAEELHRLCEKAEQYNRYLLVDEKTQADFADVKEEEVGTIGDKIRGIYESVKFW
jgi:hypothetical protein